MFAHGNGRQCCQSLKQVYIFFVILIVERPRISGEAGLLLVILSVKREIFHSLKIISE